MRKVIVLLAAGVAGCSSSGAMDVGKLAKPAGHLMEPSCESPPYPGDEGNPDSRAKWLVEDGKCDTLNRSKVEGLQNYARVVTSRTKKP
jgi:hypothetical protein